MKRKIVLYSVLLMVASAILSGCGSNSKKDPIVPTPAPATNGYAFKNVSTDLDITTYSKYTIEFQLTKDELVVPSASVSMKAFDKYIGSVDAYVTTTDENGIGKFIYSPPTVFPDTGTLTILYTDGNITIEQNINLHFKLDLDASDGRATELSISYESSSCDVKRGNIGHYHIHAVDRNSNLPIVGIPVTVSLVNGVKEINHNKVQIAKGNIYNTSPVQFNDNTVDFLTQTDIKRGDNLIIFPSENKADISYIGGWNINSLNDENLTLTGDYTNLLTTTDLTYIVGNEKRLLGGENGEIGEPTVAHVEIVESETDSDGYVYFDIVSDFLLAGHTVTVEAHGNENGRRIGVAKKVFLRLDDDKFSANDVTVPNNQAGLRKVSMHLTINPSCSGNQWLIETPVDPGSFSAKPVEHCNVVASETETSTDANGNIEVAVRTDGNETATSQCTVSWEGGPGSLMFEY